PFSSGGKRWFRPKEGAVETAPDGILPDESECRKCGGFFPAAQRSNGRDWVPSGALVHYITFSRPILRTVADKNLTAAWAIAFLALRPQIQIVSN
ncbi:MAG: hypothetical protein QOI53_3696, partial [Verrucomicrobiota bacterium]|nr:hypothetical protein [Verrucomicrobiota bacterium]